MFRSFYQPASQANEDPMVWLDGAKPPPKVCLQVLKKVQSVVTFVKIFDQ